MPDASWPFRRLLVDHLVRGGSRVWWQLDRHFLDPQPHTYTLQVGMTGNPDAVDWVNVGLPAVNATFAVDDQQRLFGKELLTHYRVLLTTPLNQYVSQPVGVNGLLNERDWGLAREIVRKERLRNALSARQGYLLKRMRFGKPCKYCLDPLTREITNSNCQQCHGVGFEVGYHAPLPLQFFDINPELIENTRDGAQLRGTIQDTFTTARVVGFPSLESEDVWVDAHSDERWVLHELQKGAVMRGLPLVYAPVRLALAPFTHPCYQVAVPGEPELPEQLPTAGCGSILVDHDYGGADALAYVGACGGVEGATITATAANVHAAGGSTAAATYTIANGRWAFALRLDPGDYVLCFQKSGEYGPNFVNLHLADSSSSSSATSAPADDQAPRAEITAAPQRESNFWAL